MKTSKNREEYKMSQGLPPTSTDQITPQYPHTLEHRVSLQAVLRISRRCEGA